MNENAPNAFEELSSTTADPMVHDAWRTAVQDDEKVDRVKVECVKRVREVKWTNTTCKTSAAFMSIPATIMFLSKWDLSSFYVDTHELNLRRRSLQERYIHFIDKYFLGKEREPDPTVPSVSSLLDVVRRGLQEGATFLPCDIDDKLKPYKIVISQRERIGKPLRLLEDDIMSASRKGLEMTVVFNSDELCSEMARAIGLMFSGTTKKERGHITDMFEKETPLLSHAESDAGQGIVP